MPRLSEAQRNQALGMRMAGLTYRQTCPSVTGESVRAASIRFHDQNVVEVKPFGGGSVMVWGGISANTKTPLVVIRGNLNAERYLNEVLAT